MIRNRILSALEAEKPTHGINVAFHDAIVDKAIAIVNAAFDTPIPDGEIEVCVQYAKNTMKIIRESEDGLSGTYKMPTLEQICAAVLDATFGQKQE